jgi:hypothetical protein
MIPFTGLKTKKDKKWVVAYLVIDNTRIFRENALQAQPLPNSDFFDHLSRLYY